LRTWRGPRYDGEFPTLGHLALRWTHQHLPSPSDDTRSLTFTPDQAASIIRWYRLDPKSGRYLYTRGAEEEAKGYGKSPKAAAIALFEFAGPACFDGWDDGGEPIGVPWGTGGRDKPWVQIAAVSEDQTDNTYSALYEMLTANGHRAAKALSVDAGRTRLYLTDRPGVLEPVTASAGSREGQRLTYAVLDETHLWTARNGGRKLANTLRRNVGKMGGRTYETTNAPTLGEKSVAEQTGVDAEAGAPGILHIAHRPSVEPQPDWTDDQYRAALTEVYGHAPWIDQARILAEVRDPATDWTDALRFYFNIRTTGAGRAVDPRVWDALARPERDVPAGSYVGAGFDGSISLDSTILRCCTPDGYAWTFHREVRPVGDAMLRWQEAHPGGKWQVDRTAVNAAVARLFATYRVGRLFCDPPFWRSEIEAWEDLYGEDANGDPVVLMLDTNVPSRFAKAVDRWRSAIATATHTHDGDPLTSDNVKGAQLRKFKVADGDDDNRTLYVLVKGEDRRRIDEAVADVLALEAAMTMAPESDTTSIYESRGLFTV